MSGPASPQKVALATWFPADPSAPKGGVEAVSVNLARALSRSGLEVHVVTVQAGISQPETSRWENVEIHRLPRGTGPLLRFAAGRGRRLVQDYLLRLKPDVVHAHDTFGIMTRGLNVPRVFTIHGFIHEDTRYHGGLKASFRSWLWKWEELKCWREQPHIISISPYVRERLKGIATGIIHDIENPIADECFETLLDEKPGTVFSAAVICERKNTLGLAKAFAIIARRCPEARLRIAGPVIEPAYGEALKRFITTEGLTDRIDLTGSITGAEIRRELASASIFALVSFEEGAPMGIAEAMAAGIPVVTSNRCGMPYMIRHGESGYLVRPDDSEDIAAHIFSLLSGPDLRDRMGREARRAAERMFHPQSVASKTIAVYQRAYAKPGSAALT